MHLRKLGQSLVASIALLLQACVVVSPSTCPLVSDQPQRGSDALQASSDHDDHPNLELRMWLAESSPSPADTTELVASPTDDQDNQKSNSLATSKIIQASWTATRVSVSDQPPAETKQPLTLADLVALALESNPTIQQATAVIRKAQSIRSQVGKYPNPSIGYSGEEIGDDGTAGIQSVFFSQTIVLGDKQRLNQETLDEDIRVLEWQRETQRLRVRNDVRMSFVDTLGAKRRVELATRFVALTKVDIESAKRLLEAKLGTTPDILQAKIQNNNMSITHRNALTEYGTARRKLAILVGQPNLDLSSLKGDIGRKLPKRDLEQSYEELLSVSPELKMAQARVARAQAAIRRQKAQPIPNVTAQIGAGYNSVGGDEIASVQLAVPWPLFNKNAGNIDAAQADYSRALQDVERQKLILRLQLTEVFRQYLQARNEIERYQEELLSTADENMSLTEKGYNRLNKFSILRLLTARRSYFDANLQYVQSLINLRRADVLIDGLLITGALDAPSDFSVNAGQRSQAFGQK